jgi:hypothetical protein
MARTIVGATKTLRPEWPWLIRLMPKPDSCILCSGVRARARFALVGGLTRGARSGTPCPENQGQRNELRGPGYFEVDFAVSKAWKVTESQEVKFSWETFNLTNSARFDAAQSTNNFSLVTGLFGEYSGTLTSPRVMQFSLRYEF